MRTHLKRALSHYNREKNVIKNELFLAYNGTLNESFLKLQLAIVNVQIAICETLLGK
jgi:hypothetical protein